MKSFAPKHLLYRAKQNIHFKQAVEKIECLENEYPTAEKRLDIPFKFRGKGYFKSIKPMQSVDEISQLYNKVIKVNPQRVLEIGTCHGGTLYLWAQAASEDAHILSIDLPEGQYGGGYRACRIPLYESFAKVNQTITLIRDDSHAETTKQKIATLLDGEELDFLFIDGDHTYDGVKRDFELYRNLVKPGGLIALHDICQRPTQPDLEVWKFWPEIKNQYEHEEFIERDPEQRKIGIGLIKLPEKQ